MSLKPTKSVYKGLLNKRGHAWSPRDELTRNRLLALLCIALLPTSIGLYAGALSTQSLTLSQGDGLSLSQGQLGYSRICFTGLDPSASPLPQDCAHISTSCTFSYSPATLALQQAVYGTSDTSLPNCAEFNAYRAFHVMGLIFAGVAFLLMLGAHVAFQSVAPQRLQRVRIYAMVAAFMAGASGVIAHCLFIDWWDAGQAGLVTLGLGGKQSTGTSTPSYVELDHSFFEMVGGWVTAIVSSLFYVWTFTPSTSKREGAK